MTTPARTAANRANALKSTGPRTSGGKAVSSRNALRVGLFAGLVVVEAAGESADEFDRFRLRVVRDLAPVGAVEHELADRVAAILWRLRRVVRYEAAALLARVPALPPDPDAVEPDSRWIYRLPNPAVPDPPWVTLAATRARVGIARRAADVAEAAAGWLDVLDAGAVGVDTGYAVVTAAAGLLGWPPHADPSPWDPVLAATGARPAKMFGFPWTGELLVGALNGAAQAVGKDPVIFRGEVRAALVEDAVRQRGLAASREAEVKNLAERMRADRERAAAGVLYADDAVTARVAKAEGHLTRELDRTLVILDRVRSFGGCGEGVPGPRLVRPDGGFVLPGGG